MTKGVLLIGFGSNKPDNQKAMMDVITRLQPLIGSVYHAFIGGDEPTIGSAVKKMAENGIDEAVVIPFLTATGEMSMRYIPRHLGIGEDPGDYVIKTPAEMTIHYTRVLGENPGISDIIHRKIVELDVEDDTTGVMLITHGSQLRYNSQMAQAHADRLTAMGHQHVLTAFMDFNEPTVEDCKNFMIGRGASKIIAVPLMLASDENHNENIPDSLGIDRNSSFGAVNRSGRDVDIYLTRPVGTDDGIIDILKQMISSA